MPASFCRQYDRSSKAEGTVQAWQVLSHDDVHVMLMTATCWRVVQESAASDRYIAFLGSPEDGLLP